MFETIFHLVGDKGHPHGLSERTIREVEEACKQELGHSLPADYGAFLRESNGLCCDQGSIFCCYNDDIEQNFPGYMALDFLTYNVNFQAWTDLTDWLILGISSLDYICYEPAAGTYQIRTNGTMDKMLEDRELSRLLCRYFAG